MDPESSNLDSDVPTDNAVHELEQKLEQQHIIKEDSSSEHEHDIPNDSSPVNTDVKNTDNRDTTSPDITERTSAEQETDEYLLKEIDWINPRTGAEKRVKIITQNGTSFVEYFQRSRRIYLLN